MKPLSPQTCLRLDAAPPDPAGRWHDGARLRFLGAELVLALASGRSQAVSEGGILHLPLPPGATPRQIQDAAEAWLRRQALRVIDASLLRQGGERSPAWALSFATKGGPAQVRADGSLRFNWRLIEQPPHLIDQVVKQALASMPRPAGQDSLWDPMPA